MKWLLIVLLVLIGSCGGGGSSSAPSTSGSPSVPTLSTWTYIQHAPIQSNSIHHFLDGRINAVESRLELSGNTLVCWGSCDDPALDQEEFGPCLDGKYICLMAYISEVITLDNGDKHRYRYVQIQDKAEQLVNGVWVVLPNPTEGQIYAPATYPTDSLFVLRVHGRSTDDRQHCIDVYGVFCTDSFFQSATFDPLVWFWQHQLRYQIAVVNPCWTGDAINARDALRQDEAWWDDAGGWSRNASGELINNIPTGNSVVYSNIWQSIGKGSGYVWQGGINRCAIN